VADKRIARAAVFGDPNIGLFGFATDSYAIAPKDIDTKVLKVKAIDVRVARTMLAGLFLAGNSNGILAPWIMADDETRKLQDFAKKLGIPVTKIKSKQTALGNLVVCNDKGAIVSPLLRENMHEIKKTLGVRVMEGRLMNLDIPGSLCVATNEGLLLNMHASAADLKFAKKALGVEGDVGTVNFGSGFVKSGIIANSNGLIIGSESTGPEISRAAEVFKFL